jgi:GGDEF domain-containing protein
MEDYNRRTTLYLHRPAGEWKDLAATLTSALASMAIASEQYNRRLEEIAAAVPAAEGVDEIHRIQRLLATCLADIQQESLQGRMDSVPAATNGPDPVTGFATRAQAEEALAQAWQTEPASYVAVMVLDRLQIFNMRFGNTVGDEVFRFFGTFLNRQLRTGDRLFRWSDSALMALLPRPGRLEMVRNEVSRLMEARCEHTVQTASRTILLPIVARWTVFPCMAAPRLLIQKIDAFAARDSHRSGGPHRTDIPAGRAGA